MRRTTCSARCRNRLYTGRRRRSIGGSRSFSSAATDGFCSNAEVIQKRRGLWPGLTAYAGIPDEPKPNPDEAAAVRWVAWPEFLEEIRARPGLYSEWCVEEARILAGNSHFDEIFRNREMFFKEN